MALFEATELVEGAKLFEGATLFATTSSAVVSAVATTRRERERRERATPRLGDLGDTVGEVEALSEAPSEAVAGVAAPPTQLEEDAGSVPRRSSSLAIT